MDLSSLIGPPIIDPRAHAPAPSAIPRIHDEFQTSLSDAHYNLFTWHLPPTSASVEPISLRQQQHRRRANRQSSLDIDASGSEEDLQHIPAQRGRRNPTDEFLKQQLGELRSRESPNVFSPARDQHSRSPLNILTTPPEHPVPRRARSCSPLIWLEDEGLWIVARPSTSASPSPPSPQSPSRRPELQLHTSSQLLDFDLQLDSSGNDVGDHTPPPPSYDSHRFRPAHVLRQQRGTVSRWGTVARRMQNLPRG
ncbi:hypothetical protein N7522_003023 [Penicillium canescens]|nr:hypothetical protein N7522_003023 [Penicillium canescens]